MIDYCEVKLKDYVKEGLTDEEAEELFVQALKQDFENKYPLMQKHFFENMPHRKVDYFVPKSFVYDLKTDFYVSYLLRSAKMNLQTIDSKINELKIRKNGKS